MAIEMTCPTCGSHDISKNGMSHRGKQNYQCRDCGRQFVEDPQWQPKPKETKALWQSIPAVYRQCAKVYTDFWEAYVTVIPSKRHEAVGKDSGLTSDIERLNNTLRQRVSRLVRKTLSFSKKLENHIGAIWLFIHDSNRQIRQKRLEQGDPVFLSGLH
jgi:insertion element IS1 protein InsB